MNIENIISYITEKIDENNTLSFIFNDEDVDIISDVLSMALKLSLTESLDKLPNDEIETVKAMLKDDDADLLAIINRISAYLPDFEDKLKQNVDSVIDEISGLMAIEMDTQSESGEHGGRAEFLAQD